MPSNAIMNIMGGYIPKVRIERVSLSNGGKLIVEDNPHIVEKEFNRQADRAQISTRARQDLQTTPEEEKKHLFKTEYDREVAKQTAIATRYKDFLVNANIPGAIDLEISDLAEMFAIRNFLVEYGLKVYVGTPEGPEMISNGLGFVSETPGSLVNFQLIKNEATANEYLDIFSGNPFGLGIPGNGDGFQIMKRHGIRDKVRIWIGQLTLPRVDSDPITLNTIYRSNRDREAWSALIRQAQGVARPVVEDAVTAVLYVLVDRVIAAIEQQLLDTMGASAGRVSTAQATSAESSGEMSVELLLNVKSVVETNGTYRSWLAKQDILDHLEFGVLEATDLFVIERGSNASSGAALQSWLAQNGITFDYNDPDNFLQQTPPDGLQRAKLLSTMSLKAAMESNGMGSLSWQSVDVRGNTVQEEATRNPQIDSDGNEVQTFTFRVERTFPAPPLALAYYTIPYLNVPKFINSLETSSNIDLDDEIFQDYREFFIGSMTRDLILKSGEIQGTKNIFSYMTSPAPPQRPERRLWEGDVRYYGQDNPATGGYVGWKTIGLGDGTEAQQRELLVEVVVNNTIQDFRTIDRLEKTMTDLTPIDAKEFDPEIKGISNNQEIELVDSYFGNLSISRDINGIVSLFCPFDMESLARRETLFGALWKNLSDDEKAELFNLIAFKHIRLKRRHVRDVTTRNRIGGLSSDVPKIDEGSYEAPDIVLLDEGYPDGVPIVTDKASFKDLTTFATTIGTPDAPTRRFGQTRFFTFKDKTANNLNSGQHQYGIEITILDSSITFFKNRREILSTQLSELKGYYNRMMESKRRADGTWSGIYDGDRDRIKPFMAEHVQDLARYAPMFAAETSVFIRTLQILNTSNSPFDLPVVIQTISTFLSPTTATRDSVNRFMKVVQDVIDKLDSLLGVSSSPPKGDSSNAEFRTASSRNATTKLFTVEQYMANLYDATIARGSGYYYMRPKFHGEPRESPGIRLITSADIAQSQQIELNKSFPGTVNPQLLRDFSYYTPLYVTILNNAAQLPGPILAVSPATDAFNYHTAQAPFISTTPEQEAALLHQSNLLNYLLHWWDTNEASPGWYSTMGRYNLFVDMIRSLNLIKDTTQIAQGLAAHEFRPSPAQREASDNSDSQRSKDTLLSLFSHQGVTLIDRTLGHSQVGFEVRGPVGSNIAAPPVGGNGGFNPSIATPAGGLNAAGQGVAGIAVDRPLSQGGLSDIGRDLPPATNRDPIQEYLRSLKSTVKASPNAILRNVLQANDVTMGPVQFNQKVARGDYRQFIGNIVRSAPATLPTSLKILAKEAVPRAPIFADVTATLNNEVRFANHGGIFDIHFNKVMELQVLVGFESPEQSSGTVLVDRPIWRKFHKEDLETNSICRLIPYDNSGIGVAHPAYLEMPVFDRIFLVKGSGGEDVG